MQFSSVSRGTNQRAFEFRTWKSRLVTLRSAFLAKRISTSVREERASSCTSVGHIDGIRAQQRRSSDETNAASAPDERRKKEPCARSLLLRRLIVTASLNAAASAYLGLAPAPAHAHIPTEGFLRDAKRPQTLDELSQGFLPYAGRQANAHVHARPYIEGQHMFTEHEARSDPSGEERVPQGPSVREQVEQVNMLTGQARAAAEEGDYQQALERYTTITSQYADLALADRARLSRALLLYQTGQVSQALLELEDEEVALIGNAEVHAALAALLWVERPLQRGRAETQWEIASEFDTRYSNVEWVRREKRWPPRMLVALDKFLHVQ